MDKIEIFLTKQQVWLAWLSWKLNLIPCCRRFWKERYNLHKSEITGSVEK